MNAQVFGGVGALLLLFVGCTHQEKFAHQAPPPARSASEIEASPSKATARWEHPEVIQPRSGAAMAPLGAKLILFGGYADKYLDDTWAWIGSSWLRERPVHAPSASTGHALAALGANVVLFGGHGPDGDSDKTWIYDGADWKLGPEGVHPPARAGHALATFGERVVLFGGTGSTGLLDDTWLWDGKNWAKWEGSGPPARAGHAMATTSAGILMFGGFVVGKALGDTWLWNGHAWSKQSPQKAPPPRGGHTLATVNQKTLLLGGASTKYLHDAWIWDGTNWTELGRDARPAGCFGQAAAALGSEIVSFGGVDDLLTEAQTHARLCETWAWDGSRFSEVGHAPRTPSPRDSTAMVSFNGKALLFGGSSSSVADETPWRDDTWEWDEHGWTERHPKHRPPGREEHTLAVLGRKVVLFGGSGGLETRNDTWEWDGNDWTRRESPTSPPKRRLHGMATLGQKVVLFGGLFQEDRGDRNLDDTWEWDGQTWTQIATPQTPTAGGVAGMVSLGSRIVMVIATPGPLWEWNGKSWRALEANDGPSRRSYPAVAAAGDQLFLFGGESCPPRYCRDTWRWIDGRWTRYANEDGPVGRTSTAIAVSGDRLVLFGGFGDGGILGDTWSAKIAAK